MTPAERLAAARKELEAATNEHSADYRGKTKIRPRTMGPGVELVSENMGEGADIFQITTNEEAAWIAQTLIRIFGLEVSEYHGSWLVRTK